MSGLLGHIGLLLGGLWSPAQLASKPKVWLDDSSSLVTVSSAVSTWGDRSGNAWDFTQPTSGVRPTLGALGSARAVVFDKSASNRLSNGSDAARDLHRNTGAAWGFVVFRRTATGAATEVFFGSSTGPLSADARFRMDINSEKPRLAARRLDGVAAETLLGTASLTASQTYMMLIQIDYASTRVGSIYLDGTLDSSRTWGFAAGNTSDTRSLGSLSVGSNMNGSEAYFGGSMLAMLSGNGSILGAGDIDKIFGWAAWRYGLQANLPIGHPYKNSPP